MDPAGAVPVGAGAPPEVLVGNGGAEVRGTVDVGVAELELELELELGVDAAAALLVAEVKTSSDVVEAETGAAVAAHAHTSEAADCTAKPVIGPQADKTHERAALAIAAAWEELHWQAKSVSSQPTSWAAGPIQSVCREN